MPDHLHMIVNPRDGRIKEFTGQLKAVSAKAIVRENCRFNFAETELGHQVWQESFKDVALWSTWMIWQKINFIDANPIKAAWLNPPKTIIGRVFDLFTHRVMSRWQWIMSGGGRKIPRSCQRQ